LELHYANPIFKWKEYTVVFRSHGIDVFRWKNALRNVINSSVVDTTPPSGPKELIASGIFGSLSLKYKGRAFLEPGLAPEEFSELSTELNAFCIFSFII